MSEGLLRLSLKYDTKLVRKSDLQKIAKIMQKKIKEKRLFDNMYSMLLFAINSTDFEKYDLHYNKLLEIEKYLNQIPIDCSPMEFDLEVFSKIKMKIREILALFDQEKLLLGLDSEKNQTLDLFI